MDYLSESQIGIAKSAISNIYDKMKSIETEIYTRQKPYKNYLNEKLDSVKWDVQVLLNLAKPDKVVTVNKDTKLIIQNVLFSIEEKCKDNEKVWNEDIFSTYLWNELWNLNEKVINTDKIDEVQINLLIDIENKLCEKENDGYEPIDIELHKEFIDLLNFLNDELLKIS